jgi:S-formylglutathione hydrolase FrmB
VEAGARSIESERVRVVEVPSPMLSEFHGRDVAMRAAVVLPPDFDPDSDRRYPAYYWIGGFGSDHTSAARWLGAWDATGLGDDIIRIALDAQCYGGHHTFADSANNGPVGTALVKELIPHLERTFPLVSAPTARFVSGHSSGGWACLWLQITYPDFFGGVWSLAPDPVDFRDFQQINLYQAGVNMYRDDAGNPRPLARRGETVMLWYEPFCQMEFVRGEGGQIRSFEWVFSPQSADGLPRPLFDRETGVVDPDTARAWEAYDIRLVMERNWPTLGPKLAGKLHIVAGEEDTFYLEGAVEKLDATLQRLGSDASIEVVPGADHGSFATVDLRRRIDEQLLAIFERHHPEHAAASDPAPQPGEDH